MQTHNCETEVHIPATITNGNSTQQLPKFMDTEFSVTFYQIGCDYVAYYELI